MTAVQEDAAGSNLPPLITQFENIIQLGKAYYFALTKNAEELEFTERSKQCANADYDLERQLREHSLTDVDAKNVVVEFRSWARGKECVYLSKKQENPSQDSVRRLENELNERSTNLNLTIAQALFIAYGRLDDMLKFSFGICDFNRQKEKARDDDNAINALLKQVNEWLRALMCSPAQPLVVETKLPESSECWQPIETAPEGNGAVTVFNPGSMDGGEVVQAVRHSWKEDGETFAVWLTADYHQLSKGASQHVLTRVIEPTLWREVRKP